MTLAHKKGLLLHTISEMDRYTLQQLIGQQVTINGDTFGSFALQLELFTPTTRVLLHNFQATHTDASMPAFSFLPYHLHDAHHFTPIHTLDVTAIQFIQETIDFADKRVVLDVAIQLIGQGSTLTISLVDHVLGLLTWSHSTNETFEWHHHQAAMIVRQSTKVQRLTYTNG